MSYEFKNNSSLKNIPPQLEGLVEDTIETYKRIIPEDQIICIYAAGSVVRGNFKPNISDFDTNAIIKRQLTGNEQSERYKHKAILDSNWESKGVDKVDIGFVNYVKFMNDEMPKMNFIFATDGTVIHGQAPPIKRLWPDPGSELSSMLNGMFGESLAKYRKHVDGQEIFIGGFSVKRWIAKQALRLLYGLTLEQSGSYTAQIENYVPNINEHLPSESNTATYLYKTYLSGEADPERLLESCVHALNLAKKVKAI